MVTALNGILIVALTMMLGLHFDDRWLIAGAFAMAGTSYLVNILDDWNSDGNLRVVLFLITIALGGATYAYAAIRLFGG